MPPVPRRDLRALFLSDVHLGARVSQGARLVDFLRHHRAASIYLVGDIIDGWRLRSRWHWQNAYSELLDELLAAARAGSRVVYLPGNHDAFLHDFYGTHFCGIEVMESAIHVGADGRRYLVAHGDQFDRLVRHTGAFAALCARANIALVAGSAALERACVRLNLPRWSLSQWLKRNVKKSVGYVGGFERAIAELARQNSCDGIICGHVHHPVIHDDLGVRYINCGDWVESCTAAAERLDGTFEILAWPGGEDAAPDPALARQRGATRHFGIKPRPAVPVGR